jgi:ATP-dependent protease HslVU (ClpYQ) peptidase subunit
MTLIIGLKSDNCVLIGAEQEEAGYISKRSVTKLRLITTGRDWTVVVGGAGDAAVADNAMHTIEKNLQDVLAVNGQVLMDVTDSVLDEVHTKYIDKDRASEGISLIVGASCSDGLHLISTAKRVPQPQDRIAYAGIGGEIAVYFMDRLHETDADWTYTAKVAGFTLQQAIESCRYCSGEAEIYVLQRHPNPRWRSLGTGDVPVEFVNHFQRAAVANHLRPFVEKCGGFEGVAGYSDEHHPAPISYEQADQKIKDILGVITKPEGRKP